MSTGAALAIDGGEPVLPEGPPQWPQPDENVRAALEAAYADGSWGRYLGPHGAKLEGLIAELCGTNHVRLCSSGTIAVELALRGLKVGTGDEVILAAYDFPGNFRAVEAVGARPVLVNLAASSWRLDDESLAAAIGPATKAIIASHLHGWLVRMDRVCAIAAERGIAVVEDACQVPGALVAGKAAGSWGDCGVLSFGGSKLLTAGRGGAVVTNREDVVQRIKVFSERGNEAFPLSELQAAVLAPQISTLAAANERRLAAVPRLISQITGAPGLVIPEPPISSDYKPAFYKLPMLLGGANDDCSSPEFEQRRGRFISAVQAEGVALDEGFRGFARRSLGRCRIVGDLANARRASAATVLLHHPVLLEPMATIDRVAKAIGKVAAALA